MTSDEAEAAVWLEEQFWAELHTSEIKFLWRPRRNAETGQLMWLCRAVCATSGRAYYTDQGKFEFTTVRWYKPKDFVLKALSNT